MTITKNSLVNLLHDEVGLNKREAKEFIEVFFEAIKSELESGNDVKISGFEIFILEISLPDLEETLKQERMSQYLKGV